MTRPTPGPPARRWLPLLVAVAAIGAALVLLPSLNRTPEPESTTTVATLPQALADRAAFGIGLNGALAYLGDNRMFNLIDLNTGRIIGSKGLPSERVPAAASSSTAYLGRLPAGSRDGNWDQYRATPWSGTEYLDLPSGASIAFSPWLETVAVARRSDSDDTNSVEIVTPDTSWTAAASDGLWSFVVWVGEEVLVRELTGNETRWWLIDGREQAPPREIDLPTDFLPITGTEGLVMGALDEGGVIIHLDDGAQERLTGAFSWAAQWQPGYDRPIVATVGGEPPALIGYYPDGTFAWSAPLRDPVTRFHGGVAWSPDGTYLVTASRGTLEAYNRVGQLLGRFDRALPVPQTGADAAWMAIVPSP